MKKSLKTFETSEKRYECIQNLLSISCILYYSRTIVLSYFFGHPTKEDGLSYSLPSVSPNPK